ncbi:MAG TPA: DUF2079 domain-containing protein [Chitinispirillaceae bacterium]|nr:DUF2079 domain-containing protein [Chitinispirillaceae bacterium]
MFNLTLFFIGAVLYFLQKNPALKFLYYPLLICISAILSRGISVAINLLGKSGKKKSFLTNESLPDSGLIALALVYLVLFSFLSVGQYDAFISRMYDLGNMDQAIWSASHGKLLQSTDMNPPFENSSRFSVHIEPVFFVFAALYRIMENVKVLLVAQVLLICIAILTIYAISVILLKDRWKSFFVAIIFSSFPALQFMTLFDFHGDVLAIAFLLLSYLAYLKKKSVWYWVFIGISLMCKEYVALAITGFGISLLLMHKDKATAIPTVLLGLAWFLLSSFVVIPLLNKGNESIVIGLNYADIGGRQGISGIIRYSLKNPVELLRILFNRQNVENLFYLLFPLLFIPFRSWKLLIGAVPIIAKDLLTGLDIYNHRLAPAVPFLFIAFIYSLREDLQWKKLKISKEYMLQLTISATLIASFCYGPSPLGHRFWRERHRYFKNEHSCVCQDLLSVIPDSVAVSVSEHLAPHVTHRQYCFVFPRPMTVEKRDMRDVEYICIDTTNRESLFWNDTSYILQTIPDIISLGFNMLKNEDGVFLFKRADLLTH